MMNSDLRMNVINYLRNVIGNPSYSQDLVDEGKRLLYEMEQQTEYPDFERPLVLSLQRAVGLVQTTLEQLRNISKENIQ